MNIVKSKLFLPIIIVAMFATMMSIFTVASANPIRFPASTLSATATTTVTYIWPGRATTTSATLDAYTAPSPFANNYATLLVQMGASSTVSTLGINFEYSQNGNDWYEDAGMFSGGNATSTNYVLAVRQVQLKFASSTPAGLATAGNSTTTRAIKVETPVRYVRAIFTVLPGTAGANVYYEWVPARETN